MLYMLSTDLVTASTVPPTVLVPSLSSISSPDTSFVVRRVLSYLPLECRVLYWYLPGSICPVGPTYPTWAVATGKCGLSAVSATIRVRRTVVVRRNQAGRHAGMHPIDSTSRHYTS